MKLFISLALSLLCMTTDASAQNGKQERRLGRLIVKMKGQDRLGNKASFGRKFAELAKKLGLKQRRQQRHAGLLEIDHEMVGKMTEEQMAAELMATGEIEFAEPDYLFKEASLPDDPRYGEQWMHQVMKTPEAWDQTIGDEGIIAAVCDSGVDATHPDLQGRVLEGFNPVTGSNITTPHTTHGTKVAGLIAAAGNNGIGMAGMAWKTRILPIRITQGTNGSAFLSDMAECIQWAADHGAKVINLSFTGFASQTIDSAAQYARSKGALLFMAAGNQGNNVSKSPDYKSFILVGATTSEDKRASYSNFGTPIDIVAPGHQVLSTSPGGTYAVINGTSFSSPVAAGLGALIWSVNPEFTPDQIESIITTTTDNIGDSATFGNGRINASRAIAAAIELSSSDRLPVAKITLPSGRIIVNQVARFSADQSSDDQGIVKYQWVFSDGAVLEGANVMHDFAVAGNYQVKLTVWDTAGQTRSATSNFTVHATAAPLMAVKEIRMTVFYTNSYSRTESKITVVSESGAVVAGALVTASINGQSVTGITNSSGVALLKGSKLAKKALHRLTVSDVTQSDFLYDPTANVESSETIQVR